MKSIRKFLGCLILFSVLCLGFICSKEGNDSSGYNEESNNVSADDVIWLVTFATSYIPENNIDEVNRILAERGYDCRIGIKYFPEECEDENGDTAMLRYLESNYADIIWGGLQYPETASIYRLADNDMVEALDSYLETEYGKKLTEAYSENIWKASKYKGKNFYIRDYKEESTEVL